MPAADGEVLTNGSHEGVNGANGAHANGTSNGSPTDPHVIPMNDQFAFTPRKLRVVTIGAGFSGLLMAHKFQHRFPEMKEYVENVIFERHNQLGGTWLVNVRTPDIELHDILFPS